MKLRLYALRNTQTNKLMPELFFASKPDAKRHRDALNAIPGHASVVVTYGPDHRKRITR